MNANKVKNVQPLVTVITVCLNSEAFLETAILSVINQSYKSIEYIIIDGGSSDRSLDIIQSYSDFIALFISEPDKGVYDAFNKGIALANGELIGILNSDDWYHPNAVEYMVRAAIRYPDADIFHGDVLVVDALGRHTIKQGAHHDLLNEWGIRHPTVFVRRSVYDKYRFDIRFKVSADYDLMLRLQQSGKNFLYISRPITYFRPTGISSHPRFRPVIDRFIIRRRYSELVARSLFAREILECLDEYVFFLTNILPKRIQNQLKSSFFAAGYRKALRRFRTLIGH